MKIIIINGVGGSGKDSFISLLRTYTDKYVYNFSTIDEVKRIAKEFYWGGEKDDRGRTFLYELKQAWKKYNNGPVTTIIRKIAEIHQDDLLLNRDSLVFIHCREIEEIEELKNIFEQRHIPVITLFIVMKGEQEHFTNPSDSQDISFYPYDYVVESLQGLDYLNEKVKEFKKYLEKINFLK